MTFWTNVPDEFREATWGGAPDAWPDETSTWLVGPDSDTAGDGTWYEVRPNEWHSDEPPTFFPAGQYRMIVVEWPSRRERLLRWLHLR